MLFPTIETKSPQQSLLSVFLQSLIYYDEILSYFALIFQYLLFIYKYNILYYTSGTIAGELILLTILLVLNPLRISCGRIGNKGKRYLRLLSFLLLDVLFIVGCIYVITIQSSALYLEMIIAIVAVMFAGFDLILGIVVMIYYRAME